MSIVKERPATRTAEGFLCVPLFPLWLKVLNLTTKGHKELCGLHLGHSRRHSGSVDRSVNHSLYPHCRVDHQIVELSIVPLQPEILANIRSAFAINLLHLFGCYFRAKVLARVLQLFFTTAINKDMEGIDSARENAGRAAPYNNAVASIGSVFDCIPYVRHHLLAIERFGRAWGQVSLGCALPECLGEAVIPGIAPLIATLNQRRLYVALFRNLLYQRVIYQLPAQSLSQSHGNLHTRATVLALYCDHSNHGPPLTARGSAAIPSDALDILSKLLNQKNV